MNKIATALALCALTQFLVISTSSSQALKPSAEYSAPWDAQQNRWKDTVQTFQMSYAPTYTLTSRSGPYVTTYSGFTPVSPQKYQSRYYWEPQMTYAQAQTDSVHESGLLSPVRLDHYDRTVEGNVVYTRSMWNGTDWTPVQRNIAITDAKGILRSSINYVTTAGELTVLDSTHLDVTLDIKGNVTAVKVFRWTMQEPTLTPVLEQRYTLNGDGSIAAAEIWNNESGELARAMRLHSFDWAVWDRSFPYVNREQATRLLYGGEGYRSVTVDLASGESDWNEFYQIQQTFDDQNRITSYVFNGMTRDTFAFDNGLLSLSQSDDLFGGQWVSSRGSRIIYERDASGTLRGVTTQRFDPNTTNYVNDRRYFYAFGSLAVNSEARSAKISVYPNPVTNELRVESTELVQQIQVIGLTGQVLATSNSATIDVRDLTPGAYGVRVFTPSGASTRMFVKPH